MCGVDGAGGAGADGADGADGARGGQVSTLLIVWELARGRAHSIKTQKVHRALLFTSLNPITACMYRCFARWSVGTST